MVDAGYGLKAATITPEGADDVGSPNRIIRERVGGKVIVRTGRRIPGVTPVAGIHHPISVCRMAVGDAYGAESGGSAPTATRSRRTERISAPYAARSPSTPSAPPGLWRPRIGGPKWTVSPIYEGMLKEEVDAAAERHPDRPVRAAADRRTYAGLSAAPPTRRSRSRR